MTKTAKAKSKAAKPADSIDQSAAYTFNLVKETKGALRYEQEGFDEKDMDACLIGTLYLRKAHIDGTDYPKSITVAVTF